MNAEVYYRPTQRAVLPLVAFIIDTASTAPSAVSLHCLLLYTTINSLSSFLIIMTTGVFNGGGAQWAMAPKILAPKRNLKMRLIWS